MDMTQYFKQIKLYNTVTLILVIFLFPLKSQSITTSEIPKLNQNIKYQDIFFSADSLIATEFDTINNITNLYHISNNNEVSKLTSINGNVLKIIETNNGFLFLQRNQKTNESFTRIGLFSNAESSIKRTIFKQNEIEGFTIVDFNKTNENLLITLEKLSTQNSYSKITKIILIKNFQYLKPKIKNCRVLKKSQVISTANSEHAFYILQRQIIKGKRHNNFHIAEAISSINQNGDSMSPFGGFYSLTKSELENSKYYFIDIKCNQENQILMTAVYSPEFSQSFPPNVLFTQYYHSLNSPYGSNSYAFLDDSIINILGSNSNTVYVLTNSENTNSNIKPKVIAFHFEDRYEISLPPIEYDYSDYLLSKEQIKNFKMNQTADTIIFSTGNGNFFKSSL